MLDNCCLSDRSWRPLVCLTIRSCFLVYSFFFLLAGYFISESGFRSLLQSVVSDFSHQLDQILRDASTSLSAFEVPLTLLSAVYDHRPLAESAEDIIASAMPDVFLFAYLVPLLDQGTHHASFQTAERICVAWSTQSQAVQSVSISASVKEKLRGLLNDTRVRPR